MVAILTSLISAVVVETPRNRIVRLAPDGPVPVFQAGQYVRLGDHGQPLREPYSIACSHAQAAKEGSLEFLIQVWQDESPGAHLARLAVGRRVDVEGPFGTFVVPEGERPRAVVLIGGGTGIAPLRAIWWEILSKSPATRVLVLQSARTPGELSYAGELRRLANDGRITLVETVTREAPRAWLGRRGRIDARMLAGLIDGPDTWCFVCGPDSLVKDVPKLLASIGVDTRGVRAEHWADPGEADDVTA